MKLVELEIEVYRSKVTERVVYEYEIVKETEFMYTLSGGIKKRIDKRHLGIKRRTLNTGQVVFEAIVFENEVEDTKQKLREAVLAGIKEMDDNINTLKIATRSLNIKGK